MANLGKEYRWSGADHTKASAAGQWILGTGGVLVTSATARTAQSAADWIISDPLDKYTRCFLRVKCTKTTGAAKSALMNDFDIHAVGVHDLAELGGLITTGSGEQAIYLGREAASWQVGVLGTCQLDWIAEIALNEFCYNTFRFAADHLSGNIQPFKYVACVIYTAFSADASAHGWQFNAQWVYA